MSEFHLSGECNGVQVWTKGLHDPGPFLVIQQRCATCGAVLAENELDERDTTASIVKAVDEACSKSLSHGCQ